jgi:hypothetical protein
LATKSRQDWRVSGVRGAATTDARADRSDRVDIGLAHTLLFPYRCVAAVTRRLFSRQRYAAPRVLAPALAAAALAAASGCFTNPINRAPVITQINPSPGSPAKGQSATFTAIGSDPDQDQLTWTWIAKQGDCPDARDPATWPHDTMAGEPGAPATFVVSDQAYTKSPKYCVWAFATDRYGAVGAENLLVIPGDNAPVVTMQMVVDPGVVDPPPGPVFPAYSTFQFTAVASDLDGDPLEYTWGLAQQPTGSRVTFSTCPGHSSPDDDDTRRCFTADLPGTYSVSVSVSANHLTANAISQPLMVLADAPPCIDATTPLFAVDPTANTKALTTQGYYPDQKIRVDTVYDDGNPFPQLPDRDRPHFTWFLGTNDSGLHYVDNVDYQELPLSKSDYRQGDYVNARLEVKDQNGGAIDAILAACGNNADFCATPVIPAGRATCWVRVSWRIHLTLTYPPQ